MTSHLNLPKLNFNSLISSCEFGVHWQWEYLSHLNASIVSRLLVETRNKLHELIGFNFIDGNLKWFKISNKSTELPATIEYMNE